jgi:hypothetical protein
MNTLIKGCLLALTLVIVFFSPAKVGYVLYYALFPLLFLLVYLFYRVSYWVSEKDVRKVRSEPSTLSFFCAMVPSLGEGDLTRGRLVIDHQQLVLYKKTDKGRTKKIPCKPVWNLAVSDLQSIGFGPVLSVRKGLILYVGENSYRFVYTGAKKHKKAITQALGWKDIPQTPQPVEVFSEAASAPSFSTAVENKESGKEKD